MLYGSDLHMEILIGSHDNGTAESAGQAKAASSAANRETELNRVRILSLKRGKFSLEIETHGD